MKYERTPEQAAAQEALQRQAEAATQALAPVAEEAAGRLRGVAWQLEELEAEPLGLSVSQRQILRKTAQRLRGWADADTEAKPVGYLTRAQFARLAQVSANTLVKWHAAGSLVPAYTHPLTHYRYYKPEQVAEVRNARQRRQRKAAK